MLTTESLASKFSNWISSLGKNIASPKSGHSPIQFYQNLFSFLHELKGAIGISDIADVKVLEKTVLECEAIARRLAQAEAELDENTTLALYQKLVQATDLQMAFNNVLKLNPTVLELSPAHAAHCESLTSKTEFVWEALSKGRAKSSIHYNYGFYKKEAAIALSLLTQFDQILNAELKPFGAVAIIRSLSPQPSKKKSNELELKIVQVAAFPKNTSSTAISGWMPLL